jgi:hypothetical protein
MWLKTLGLAEILSNNIPENSKEGDRTCRRKVDRGHLFPLG